MSKFDDVIKTKLGQLHEAGAVAAQPATGQAQPATAQAQPATGQAQQNQQAPNQTQQATDQTQQDPGQVLGKVFQTLKFSDSNSTIQALNNALKTAGNAPGIKEFFSTLAFDPQKGFMVAQATPNQPLK